MVGRSLGNYRILQKIGAGGMGEVYLAQHRRLARKTAVKVLRPQLSATAHLVERFFAEARAASVIRHHGIVEIIDCDVHEGCAFIVMEHLEGESLAAHLRRVGPMSSNLAAAALIARQIAQAVGAAHSAGIVHRDLKPDNVFLCVGSDPAQPPRVKILDFGIAKLLANDDVSAANLTRTGSLLGTPLYMSPEQCRGISQIDARADLYSLGCMLFEMLTGQPPFLRENPGDLLVCHITEPPPAPSALAPGLPAALDALILRLLAKAAADRPQSMVEVDAALAPFDLGVRLEIEKAPPSTAATAVLPSQPESATSPTVGLTTPLHPPAPQSAERGPGEAPATTFGSVAGQLGDDDLRPKPRRWIVAGAALAALAGAAFGVRALSHRLASGERSSAKAVPEQMAPPQEMARPEARPETRPEEPEPTPAPPPPAAAPQPPPRPADPSMRPSAAKPIKPKAKPPSKRKGDRPKMTGRDAITDI